MSLRHIRQSERQEMPPNWIITGALGALSCVFMALKSLRQQQLEPAIGHGVDHSAPERVRLSVLPGIYYGKYHQF